VDVYWDPKEECIQNKCNEMLILAISDVNGFYWKIEAAEFNPPKCKKSRQMRNW